MAPGTEFARDFCAGIGPLQLGVVLVFFLSELTPFLIFHNLLYIKAMRVPIMAINISNQSYELL